MMRMSMALAIVLSVVGLTGGPAPAAGFELLGIGGAGGMFCPGASPEDPNLMLICSDMSGCYRSTDGGKQWTMIPYRQINGSTSCRPYFVKDAILWVSGSALKISRDKGVTWQSVGTAPGPWGGSIKQLAGIAENNGLVIFVGNDTGLWRSADSGQTWQKAQDTKCVALVDVGSRFYAAMQKTIQMSTDHGKTWGPLDMTPFQGQAIFGLTGGVAPDGSSVLFASAWQLGILRSTDWGKTWEVVLKPYSDQNLLLMASNQTRIAYAAQSGASHCRQVWNTTDGGATWKECFRMGGNNGNVEMSWVQTDLGWGYYIVPNGMGVCPTDANEVLVSTQGDFYVSRDAAKTWQQVMNRPVMVDDGGQQVRGYECNGLEVTTNWWYLFDPNEKDRTYIAYTDIGFARSPDRGKTWIPAAKGCPWGNTFYEVVFDPNVPGRMYAATSGKHDIPHWGQLAASPNARGGVCVSDDYARNWRVLGTGLPNLPCTSICIDPKSPKDNLTFYVTLYEGGVFKSTDNGRTWVKKSDGLGNPGNMHAFMVRVHPKTGDIYCSITAIRDGNTFPVPGGLWKSTDGGDHWTDLTKELKLHWSNGFALDPNDPNVIYLTAATIPGGREGGLYKTADGGKSWTRILRDEDFAKTGGDGFVQAIFVNLHPDKPELVYLGTETHSLWVSPDAGKTWKQFPDFPFQPVANVAFDPLDHTIMYVSTHGGGVWRGNYLP